MIALNESTVRAALSDPRFLQLLPEMARVQALSAEQPKTAGGGCSNCQRRRLARVLLRDFVMVVDGLTDEGRGRLAAYFKSDVLVPRQDPKTGTAAHTVIRRPLV